MAAATGARKSVSIHDYPEHLNPFREDDNHNKIRFWTIGRKLNRSNSINFSGIRQDLKNSWAFRSFMRKGKKQQEDKPQTNGDTSPIVYRRALQYSTASNVGARNTVGSPERPDRYVYGGSVTPLPLPRSRFQERLRSTSQHEVSSLAATPRMARSEIGGSRLSIESSNPFDEDVPPVPPVRASRRKKKRAPMPPAGAADTSVTSGTSELTIVETPETKPNNDADLDVEAESMKLNIELKIVEDEEVKDTTPVKMDTEPDAISPAGGDTTKTLVSTQQTEDKDEIVKVDDNVVQAKAPENKTKSSDSLTDILKSIEFPKVDIVKYRRNSSVNEDDIRLRRGNLEDFQLDNKRSKSLTNTHTHYVTFDINLNDSTALDANENEEPQKVICKLLDETSRKHSIDTISSTEREFNEIDKVRREFEREINKLNAALEEDFSSPHISVSEIKKRFDNSDVSSPNPIPKPRRSNYSDPGSPLNGNIET